MNSIKISGSNQPIYHCLDCGNELTIKEYAKSRVRCLSCRMKYYNGSSKYMNILGENDIDAILINRRKVR